jgi:hypothetical protein
MSKDSLARSTNTPNTSLLGPAKKRVLRTAISPQSRQQDVQT